MAEAKGRAGLGLRARTLGDLTLLFTGRKLSGVVRDCGSCAIKTLPALASLSGSTCALGRAGVGLRVRARRHGTVDVGGSSHSTRRNRYSVPPKLARRFALQPPLSASSSTHFPEERHRPREWLRASRDKLLALGAAAGPFSWARKVGAFKGRTSFTDNPPVSVVKASPVVRSQKLTGTDNVDFSWRWPNFLRIAAYFLNM
mmetsp:Transcript_9204/g.22102  ORF Transcript_9204/g.22102 Transcript_9204/m.22102 type:complete len:201 (-) Transcript_9204:217-819(-)